MCKALPHKAAIVIEKNIAPAVSLEYTLCTAYSYHCMGYQGQVLFCV